MLSVIALISKLASYFFLLIATFSYFFLLFLLSFFAYRFRFLLIAFNGYLLLSSDAHSFFPAYL